MLLFICFLLLFFFFLFYFCVFVCCGMCVCCGCVWVWVCTNMQMCAYRSQRETLSDSPQIPPFWRQGLTALRLGILLRWAVSEPQVSSAGLTNHSWVLSHEFLGMNSGPRVCKTSVLLSALSPRPHKKLVKLFLTHKFLILEFNKLQMLPAVLQFLDSVENSRSNFCLSSSFFLRCRLTAFNLA